MTSIYTHCQVAVSPLYASYRVLNCTGWGFSLTRFAKQMMTSSFRGAEKLSHSAILPVQCTLVELPRDCKSQHWGMQQRIHLFFLVTSFSSYWFKPDFKWKAPYSNRSCWRHLFSLCLLPFLAPTLLPLIIPFKPMNVFHEWSTRNCKKYCPVSRLTMGKMSDLTSKLSVRKIKYCMYLF